MQTTTTPLPISGRDTPTYQDSIDQLASFYRGELSAVETYRQAMRVTQQSWVLTQLRANMASHEERARILRQRIVDLGGIPPEDSGPWGAFATTVQGAAAAINARAALSILEEGERHGLADYRADLGKVDHESLRMLENRVIPQQSQTYDSLHRIVESLSAS